MSPLRQKRMRFGTLHFSNHDFSVGLLEEYVGKASFKRLAHFPRPVYCFGFSASNKSMKKQCKLFALFYSKSLMMTLNDWKNTNSYVPKTHTYALHHTYLKRRPGTVQAVKH